MHCTKESKGVPPCFSESGLAIALAFAGWLVLTGCSQIARNQNQPHAIKGVIDLSRWDFATAGPVDLSGEYEFYWQQLLPPESFSMSQPPKRSGFIEVPGVWNGYELNGTKLSGAGHATYRLTILLNDSLPAKLAFKFLDMGTAFTVFANGKKTLAVGIVGQTPEATAPGYLPQIVDFIPDSNRLELIYQVANFHHKRGGAWELIRLGTVEQLDKIRERRLAVDLMLFGSILIVGLYHLTLLGLKKNDLFQFLFALFCLLVAVRLLTTVERGLLQIFPNMSWELFMKIEYLSAYLTIPVFVLFLYRLFPSDVHKTVTSSILAVGFLFSGIVFLTPARIFTQTFFFYQLFFVLCIIYGLSVLVVCVIRKREGAAVILLSFLFVSATIINDILDANGVIQTGHFVHVGVFVFICAHAFTLSSRYLKTYVTIDSQRKELQEKEERFRQLSENIQEVFWLGNPEKDKIIYISPAYEKIWGRSCASLYASPSDWLEAIHPDERNRVREAALTKQVSGQYDETYRILRPDGAIRWIRDRAFPVRDQKGLIYRIAGIAQDVTAIKQAEEALRKSAQQFHTIFEASPIPMVISRVSDGVILHANAHLGAVFGLSSKELSGRKTLDFYYDPSDRVKILEALEKGGEMSSHEICARKADGTPFWVLVSMRMLTLDGEPVLLAGFHDITERKLAEKEIRRFNEELEKRVLARTKKLRESEEKYRLLVESAELRISFWNREGKLMFINQIGAQNLNGAPDALVGKSLPELFPPAQANEFLARMQKVIDSGVGSFFEDVVQLHSGTRWFWSNLQPTKDEFGTPIGVQVLSYDITERKQMEEELISAKQIAERSIRAKERFLAHISHEIRTPMNAVVGITHLLQKTPAAAQQREYLQVLRSASDNLLSIIDDILDFSKLEAGMIEIEQVDFKPAAILENVKQMFQYRAEEKKLTFAFSLADQIPAALIGDPVRLKQILVNLVGNAIKFTEQGAVTVTVELVEEDHHTVKLAFSVRDTGIGILEDKLSIIFEDFAQAGPEIMRKFGGTGLGLTITKQLIEMQGGCITVESQIGKGSTFRFMLRFEKVVASSVQSGQTTAVAEQPARLDGLRILLAEDDKLSQRVAASMLERRGATVEVADNGRIAIEKLTMNSYDIVLLDALMPKMSGYETSYHIRNEMNGTISKIPILAITGFTSAAAREKVLAYGMNDYISKPFAPDDLCAKIMKLVNQQETLINESLQTV